MSIADNLLAFTFAATLLTLTPGLDTALVLRTATVEGKQQAFRAALGINAGCLLWGGMFTLIPFTRNLIRNQSVFIRG